jgi:hypothetical protein
MRKIFSMLTWSSGTLKNFLSMSLPPAWGKTKGTIVHKSILAGLTALPDLAYNT